MEPTEALNFDHLVAEGRSLYPYQTVGVAYALVAKRTFVSDEMGLGKTIQALCAIEAKLAYPAVVVCPASLKDNWAREIKMWLPNRSVFVASGRSGAHSTTDITIVNYDILSGWVDTLLEGAPNAFVLDESHNCKNKAAQRSQAAKKLADAIPEDGLVLCLTGTPILNRPSELINQLEILGRLQDIAPKPRAGRTDARSWEFSFKFRYCGAEKNDYDKWDFNGASNLDELHTKLRRSCFIRRQRSEVLGMNDTKRVVVPLSLNGELDQYREAEANFIEWLYDNEGASAARAALRAEAITMLNKLRLLSAQAKLAKAIEWIDNFLDSNPGRSLVIFAHHKAIQTALAEHYNCPTILGSQKDVEAHKARFMAGEHRLIVCSMTAAREGHTLTKASDVLFVEEPWHPGAQQQCEDRTNRIGQTAEQVFSWHLLAVDTIDERIFKIIDEKRKVFSAAVEGKPLDDTEDNVIDAIISGYRKG